jgi:hypothetical protein
MSTTYGTDIGTGSYYRSNLYSVQVRCHESKSNAKKSTREEGNLVVVKKENQKKN